MEKIRARHILVETRSKAERLLEEIKEGGDFIKLAKEHSECPSAEQGGNLGAFSRGKMVEEFEDAAFALEKGEVSDIVKTKFGFHIIKRTG